MRYTSTRDPTTKHTFAEALFAGYAPDGGLFVPEKLPELIDDDWKVLTEVWPKLSYAELATQILHPFIGADQMPLEDLRATMGRALNGFEVPEGTQHPVPVVPLQHKGSDVVDAYAAELFHGPTQCFKDLGMRATIFWLDYFAGKRKNPPTIVLTAATTGDTGPAAVAAVKELDSPKLGMVVHYPQGQISDYQRQQMTTLASDTIKIVAFDGGGDDMDRPIKNIMTEQNNFNDDEKDNVLVCGVNSYNIGRPLMQLVHFVWTYLRVVEDLEARFQQKIDPKTFRLDVVIPTGAMGNLAGCYLAKKLGIPLGKLSAGTNANDATFRVVSTGRISKPNPGEAMVPSLSEAINIQLPYNLERVLFYLTDGNHVQIREWYERLENNGVLELGAEWRSRFQQEFSAARIDDARLCRVLRGVRERFDYWSDPHTGVAFGAAEKLGFLQLAEKGAPTENSLPGGYNPVPGFATDAGFAAAADCALAELTNESSPHYLEGASSAEIVRASRQVVAGLNLRMDLVVRDAQRHTIATGTAVVYDRFGDLRLTRWMPTARPANPHRAVALVATASPCKFQAALATALGPAGWEAYAASDDFPPRARALAALPEAPPIRYRADPEESLEANQDAWEGRTRALIASIGKR